MKRDRHVGNRFYGRDGLIRRVWILIFLPVILVAFQNCGSDFTPLNGSSKAGWASIYCETDLKLPFASGYHEFLKNQCSSCHTESGSGKGTFASSDLDVAYGAFLIATPEKVRFYALNKDHASGFTGGHNAESVDQAQSTWDAAVEVCKSSMDPSGGDFDGVLTQPKRIDVLWPNPKNKYSTLTWNLDTELSDSPRDFGGAKLSIQVIRTDDGTGTQLYYLKAPSLTTGSKPIRIVGLRVRINDDTQVLATTFSRIEEEVPPAQNDVLLSAGTMVVEYPADASDELTLLIDILEPL